MQKFLLQALDIKLHKHIDLLAGWKRKATENVEDQKEQK